MQDSSNPIAVKDSQHSQKKVGGRLSGFSHDSKFGNGRMSADSSVFPSVLDWSLLLAEMESSDFDLLSQYLKKLKCNVVDLADDNGFTLLHHAVLKGQDGKVQQVVDMALAIQKPTEQQIKKWCDIRS